MDAVHHFHRRKRIYQKHEPYPSRNRLKNILDKLIYAVAILSPIATLPQVTKIWIEQNASGVSLTSWVSFLVINCFWLTYGLVHKEKPIIIANGASIVMHIAIVSGIIMYG
jgi:uncharacterized protein with PQ loop repeat